MNIAQLRKIYPLAGNRVDTFFAPLTAAMSEFEINSVPRITSFISQVGWESAQLRYVEELASGAAYDTGTLARRLGNTPEEDGDGEKWKGHGLIEITGFDNHKACADYFHISMDKIVDWLKTPEGACRSAGWFWMTHGLNGLADQGDQVKITKRINGGTNGLKGRLALYATAVKELS